MTLWQVRVEPLLFPPNSKGPVLLTAAPVGFLACIRNIPQVFACCAVSPVGR